MATEAKQDWVQDLEHAKSILETIRKSVETGEGVFLISADYGKGETDFFKVSFVSVWDLGRVEVSHITWALSKVAGYRLRDRSGFWHVAIGGGNFSKFDEIADTLARFYGVARVRWERV
jgi:hypothetical protein